MIRRIIGIVVVLAVLGGGGYYAYQRLTATTTSATASLSTTTVSTGTLVASVAASGALASPQTGNVTWQVNGTVGEVKVKVGDQVNAGDVLMAVDTNKLDTSIVQAQAALLTDQQNLANLIAPATDAQIANAELAV